jgi:prevent-host-death family protein
MKTISAKDLDSNIDSVLTSVQRERVLISRGGKPCAVIVGVENYDAEDLRLATSEEFWQMIGDRRTSGKSIPLSEVKKRLNIAREKPASKRTAPVKTRRRS